MSTWNGLRVSASPLLKQGTFVWRKGNEVVGVDTADRRVFLGMFGLAPVPPASADNLVISDRDYLIVEATAKSDASHL